MQQSAVQQGLDELRFGGRDGRTRFMDRLMQRADAQFQGKRPT